MPCITQPNLTEQQKARMDAAIARLDAALAAGTASAVIGAGGSVAFKGWGAREGVSDLCAYRKLASENSPALRRAIMRAEVMAGRKIDPMAIANGVHSHTEGQTWGTH